MGILDRFTSIVKANINELLDRAEDPEKMVDQYLREMTESLAEVREATAGVMAEEKRCKKLLDENREETEKYEELARKALAAGNEADARVFLAKKQELAGRAEGLTVAYEGAKANADKMRQMHDKLVADIEELNARKATIKAKAAVAKTQSKVNEMTSAGDRAEGARSAFDRMEAKADEMLDRANAVAELSEKPADPTEELAKKYAAAGAEAAVDDDLARLKKEMDTLKATILSGGNLRADESIAKHADWAEEFLGRRSVTAENIDEVVNEEIGRVFAEVLVHAGVYKCDAAGREAFDRFIAYVNEK